MEKKKVNYCGSGKKQNNTWLKATINIEKIKPFIEEYNGVKFIKLNINIKDEADQYGKDVSISIDEWKPEQKQTTEQYATKQADKVFKEDEVNQLYNEQDDNFDELPF